MKTQKGLAGRAVRLSDNDLYPTPSSEDLASLIGVEDYCRHGFTGIVHCPTCTSEALSVAVCLLSEAARSASKSKSRSHRPSAERKEK